jgi:hypothetical protein
MTRVDLRQVTADVERYVGETGTLQPFSGHQIPGICFGSGHCFWLFDFTSTPTDVGPYTDVRVITPDDERVLYTDPEEAAREVVKYHEFDRTVGASISWVRSGPETVVVTMGADDGTALELDVSLGRTRGTRLLNGMLAATPGLFLRSGVGTTIGTLSVNLLVDANGTRVAGRTETGRRFRTDVSRVRSVTNASATLNGTDLGRLVRPAPPVEFGDAKTTGEPLFVSCELYLERRQQ